MAADLPPTDEHIIALYRQCSEDAVEATYQKYGGLLFQLAWNILENYEDAEECVNDTCLAAWNGAADVRPGSLKSWLCRIVRNEAIDRVRHRASQKRGDGSVDILLDELAFCLPSDEDTARELEQRELASAISAYLREQPQNRRTVFIQRYYYASSMSDIAVEQGMTTKAVRQLLYRMRQELKEHLQSEGYRDDEPEF
ncbi:MAG: RNA polymerase sigma factor [Saccharofermentanales bacterium]|jgi:RNA polymerase sigma factor (sigma-70 family)|nr:RNA polymerase sigma factor [Clostridiaceae bacterium]